MLNIKKLGISAVCLVLTSVYALRGIDYAYAGMSTSDGSSNVIVKRIAHSRLDNIKNAQPAEQNTTVIDDILSTGNTPTQVSIPMSVCNFLVNNQNVCTESKVTTATAIISVAVLGGIIAAVTTAVNNGANNREQQIKDNNLLLTLLAIQNQNKPASARVCYDSAVPPNVIPCP